MNPEKAWPTVERMLYKMAWKTTERYGVPFEDARSEVYLAFMKACWRWDPKRHARFTSFACFIANCRLRSLIMDRATAHTQMPCVELNEEMLGFAPELRSECLEMLDDLSEDARELVSLLLEIPEDLIGYRMTPRQLMARVKRFMIEKRGRDKKRVKKAHRELQLRFQEAWA